MYSELVPESQRLVPGIGSGLVHIQTQTYTLVYTFFFQQTELIGLTVIIRAMLKSSYNLLHKSVASGVLYAHGRQQGVQGRGTNALPWNLERMVSNVVLLYNSLP